MKFNLSRLKKSLKSASGKNLILTIVALILVAVTMFSAVYAWVESVSSIVIENKQGDVETNITVEDRLLTKGTVNSSSGYTINLAKYFRAGGNMHLSTASSSDGTNIFFPVLNVTNKYRLANLNDKNVNYYDFDIKIKLSSSTPKDFVFDDTNALKINFGSASGVHSNIRCAITLDRGTTKVYSKEASTAAVVSSADGATSAESTLTFASSTGDNSSSIFSIKDTDYHTLNIKLWYQKLSSTPDVSAQELKIENFVIKTVNAGCTVTAKPKYSNNNSTYTYGTTGGTVSVSTPSGATSAGSGAYDVTVRYGNTATLVASANDGYVFTGWYTTGGSLKSENETWTTPTVTADITYEARFVKAYKVTVNIMTSSDGETYTQEATGNTTSIVGTNGSVALTYNPVKHNTTTKLTATAGDSYVFVGWYDTNGNQLSDNEEYTTGTITAATTIVAKFKLAQNYTVYYYNTDNWEAPYAYCWQNSKGSSNQNAVFPGEAMTHIGNNVWAYEVDVSKNYDKIIFGINSSSKTGDLDLPASDSANVYYCYDQSGTGYWTTAPQKRTVTVSSLSNSTLTAKYFNDNNVRTTLNEGYSVQIYDGSKITITNTPATGYNFTNIKITANGVTTPHTSNDYGYVLTKYNTTISGTVTAQPTTKTVYVGVVQYITDFTPTFHYWNSDGLSGDATLTATGSTANFSVGSSYWNNAAKSYTIYSCEVPIAATTGKTYRKASNDRWAAEDYTIADGTICLLFEYSNTYHNVSRTYSP